MRGLAALGELPGNPEVERHGNLVQLRWETAHATIQVEEDGHTANWLGLYSPRGSGLYERLCSPEGEQAMRDAGFERMLMSPQDEVARATLLDHGRWKPINAYQWEWVL